MSISLQDIQKMRKRITSHLQIPRSKKSRKKRTHKPRDSVQMTIFDFIRGEAA